MIRRARRDRCFKHDPMSSRARPVFDAQRINSLEFSRVVGNQNSVQRYRVSSYQCIQRSYRSTALFERYAQLSVAFRRRAVKARDLERQQELGKRRLGFISARALRSTKGELGEGYRGDP